LPVGAIEPRVVKTWTFDIIRALGHPWNEASGKPVARFDGFGPEVIRPTVKEYADSVNIEPMEPVDAIADYLLILPSHQKERRGAIQIIVLTGAFPGEVPGVLGVNAQNTSPAAIDRLKFALVDPVTTVLTKRNGAFVRARRGRHEPNAVDAPVRRIAEAFHGDVASLVDPPETTTGGRVGEWVLGRGLSDRNSHLDEFVTDNLTG
jgi:hypothetical protein